jgi:uncharacterized membrane protein YqjE
VAVAEAAARERAEAADLQVLGKAWVEALAAAAEDARDVAGIEWRLAKNSLVVVLLAAALLAALAIVGVAAVAVLLALVLLPVLDSPIAAAAVVVGVLALSIWAVLRVIARYTPNLKMKSTRRLLAHGRTDNRSLEEQNVAY